MDIALPLYILRYYSIGGCFTNIKGNENKGDDFKEVVKLLPFGGIF